MWIVDFCSASNPQLQIQLSRKPHRKTALLQCTNVTFVIFPSNKLSLLHMWPMCASMATGPKCWWSHTSLNNLLLRWEDGRFQTAELLPRSLYKQTAEQNKEQSGQGMPILTRLKGPYYCSRWIKTEIRSRLQFWGLQQQQSLSGQLKQPLKVICR